MRVEVQHVDVLLPPSPSPSSHDGPRFSRGRDVLREFEVPHGAGRVGDGEAGEGEGLVACGGGCSSVQLSEWGEKVGREGSEPDLRRSQGEKERRVIHPAESLGR